MNKVLFLLKGSRGTGLHASEPMAMEVQPSKAGTGLARTRAGLVRVGAKIVIPSVR